MAFTVRLTNEIISPQLPLFYWPISYHSSRFSTAIRANQRFVFPIPSGISSEDAASMLCGGLTVYSPLKRNGVKPGSKVGVIGIGGLGHYAVLFAKAMGAEVFAFTHSKSKAEDIKKMGADHIIDTGDKVRRRWHYVSFIFSF